MKETISSDCLFHFTNSTDHLLNILKNEYSPRYCLENYEGFDFSTDIGTIREIAIPMVCFCDIPLSKTKTHFSFYGNYGIGMKKEWGMRNGICPVTYAEKKSFSTKFIKELNALLFNTRYLIEMDKARENILNLIRFIKPYIGDFWRSNGTIKNYRFYDEREWRYVPDTLSHGDDVPFNLTKKDFLDSIQKKLADDKVSDKFKINFEPDDIKYIIIEKESQIPSMIDAIESIKIKYDANTRKKLISRIISQQNIIDDF